MEHMRPRLKKTSEKKKKKKIPITKAAVNVNLKSDCAYK